MTKKLEELFGLPQETKEAIDEHNAALKAIDENKEMIERIDQVTDKIDAALPTVRDLDTSDDELDELATMAKDNFTELVNLAMNVDPRFTGPILQSASTILGHAVTAKQAKIDKKLRTIDLQIRKARLDQTAAKLGAAEEEADNVIEGKGTIMDRNDMLRELLSAHAANNPSKT